MRRYTTVSGDRWDRISLRFYGVSHAYDRIIYANPHLTIEQKTAPLLPEGLVLEIPAIPEEEARSTAAPPWKE